MKLLFITRKVDHQDAMAGFTYGWVRELARQVEELHVICLELGDSAGLPANCHVYSLGKEQGKNRWREFWRFQKLAARLVPRVDAVIGHQNPEYAILIAPWCKLYRASLAAWYVHKAITWKTKLMERVVDIIFTASQESFRLPSRKVAVVHHGIDPDHFQFRPKAPSDRIIITSVSRLSPAKHIEHIIDAAITVHDQSEKPVELRIYGDAILAQEKKYVETLRAYITERGVDDYISLRGIVAHKDLPSVFHDSDIMVNCSATGSLDKAVLEAMSCGTLVATTNESFATMFRDCAIDMYVADARQLPNKILELVTTSDRSELQRKLRLIVEQKHSLHALMQDIIKQLS